MKQVLTKADFERAAALLNCEPEAIQAVAKVESQGRAGFRSDGFPIILFERHIFYKNLPLNLRNQIAREHPDICFPVGYGRGNYGTKAEQRIKLDRAAAIDAEAAMKACSWGAFQELGENYSDYGFATVFDFVETMKSGVDGQLEIFIKGIIKRGLADELRRHDWAGFARIYNGPAYKRFGYDTQIAEAYKAAKRNSSRSAAVPAEMPADSIQPVDVEPDKPAVQTAPQTEPQNVPPPMPEAPKEIPAPPKENSAGTAARMTIAGFTVPTFLVGLVTAIQSAIANGFISAPEVGAAVVGFIKENTKYVFLLIALIVISMALKKFWKQVTLWKQMEIAADPNKHDVEVKPQ